MVGSGAAPLSNILDRNVTVNIVEYEDRRMDVIVREGTLFSWEGEGVGGVGEFWYFFPKEVLALPCILIKKTPDPPTLGD